MNRNARNFCGYLLCSHQQIHVKSGTPAVAVVESSYDEINKVYTITFEQVKKFISKMCVFSCPYFHLIGSKRPLVDPPQNSVVLESGWHANC